MEILLWLVPAGVVAVCAMAWAAWQGRDSRGDVDRDEALERLGRALAKPAPRTRDTPRSGTPRGGGVALRSTRRDTER